MSESKNTPGSMRAARRHYADHVGKIDPHDADGFEWLEEGINKLATIIDEETAVSDLLGALEAIVAEGRDATGPKDGAGDATIPTEIWDMVQQAIAKAKGK